MRQVKSDETGGFKLDLNEYVRILWRKKHLIAIPLFFSVLVAFVGAKFLPPVYRSSVILRIENPNVATEAVQRLVQTEQTRLRDAERRAILEANITSGVFLDRLSKQLGFDRDPAVIRAAEMVKEKSYPDVTLEELINKRLRDLLRGRIGVNRAGPELFEISYMDANPEACYIIVDALSKLYIEEEQRIQLVSLRDASDFSDEQLSVYRERLNKSERDLEEFQQNMAARIVTTNPVNETNIGTARSLRRHLEVEIQDLERVVKNLEDRLVAHVGALPDTSAILRDQEVRNIRSEFSAHVGSELLRQLQGEAQLSGGTLTSEQQITAVQQGLFNRIRELIRQQYPDTERDYWPLIDEWVYQAIQLATREHKLERLRGYLATYQRNLDLAPQMNTELLGLRAEVEQNRILYEQFLTAKTSTQISEAAQNTDLATSMTVVEGATYPLKPVKPEKMKILLLAIVFGITIGGGALVLTEFTDSSFKTVEEVEKHLDIRVLGTVPKIERAIGGWRKENKMRRVVIWATTSIILTTASIFAFYFYGKATKADLITFQMTNTQRTSGRQN